MVKACKITEKSIPLNIVFGGCLVFLTLTILVPLILVLTLPSLSGFAEILSSESLWETAANTFAECICSSSMAVIIGFVYAYAVIRGKIPFAKFFAYIPFLHLMTPPFVGGLSFILLLGKNGFITSRILGLDVSLYGFPGLVIAQTLCFFPVAYMIAFNVLSGTHNVYESVSFTLGGSKLKTFFRVTLPLALPGIIAAFLFVAVSVLSDFGNPMIVAGRYKVLAVEVYTSLTGWMDPSKSSVYGLVLIIPSLFIFILQRKLLKKYMPSSSVIGGKIQLRETSVKSVSSAARILLTVFCAFITLCIFAQVAALTAGTFQRLWGIHTEFTWEHLASVKNCGMELFNSIRFAAAGACISCIVCVCCSYFVYRTSLPLKKYVDLLCQLPSAVPGTLMGLAFTITASKLGIQNSAALIITAIAIGFMPFSYRLISTSFAQIKNSLDDGARSLGASRLTVLRTVIAPLSLSPISDAFLYDFVRGVGTMSAVIFLISFDTPLASVKILNLAEQGFWGDAAALAMVLTLITFSVLLAVKSLLRKKQGKLL
ncbi:MAG: iron ABC transporter permease [Treponema sp.]|nr:iron ABC transporter permease [Treponema sp.]